MAKLLFDNTKLDLWFSGQRIRVAHFVSVTESIAHLPCGCKEFHNFYCHWHDRIGGKLFDEIKLIRSSTLVETLLPEY